MSQKDCTRKSEIIQRFLEERSQELGADTALVQRKRKLTAAVIAKMLIVGCLENPGATLNEFAAVCDDMGIDVSPQGIDNRLNASCVAFMERLLGDSMTRFSTMVGLPNAVLNHFSEINLVDSTQVALPEALQDVFPASGGCASPAGLKLQVSYGYLRGQVNGLALSPAKQPDQRCTLVTEVAQRESLTLIDLGYHRLDMLKQIDAQQAYFMTPFDHKVTVYQPSQATLRMDLVGWLRQAPLDHYERQVYIGSTARLPVRMIFKRRSKQDIERQRRLAHDRERRKRMKYAAAYFVFLEWIILITNVPASMLSADQILSFYRIRWQIELIFKQWKSQANITTIRNWRLERVLIQLYATLIGLFLFYWLIAPYRLIDGRELSLPKAFDLFGRHLRRCLDVILFDWQQLPAALTRFFAKLHRFALKNIRHHKPSTYKCLAFGA